MIEDNVTDDFYPIADDVVVGYGGQLMVGDGASPENFEAVAGVMSVGLSADETAEIKVTHLRSPNRRHEKRAGMIEPGKVTFRCAWLPNHPSQSETGGGSGVFMNGGLAGMQSDGLNRNFKIVANNGSPGTEIAFSGFVSSFTPDELTTDDKAVEASGSITRSGGYTVS